MQQLPQISASYDWLFNYWQQETTKAAQSNDFPELRRLQDKRDTLDRGVFVLMFGQFERAVDDKFITARDARIDNPDWTVRRGWDADALRTRKVPFETKLSLVLDRNSPAFSKILDAYRIRNHCAHGGTTIPISLIPTLASNLYTWAGMLRS